MPHTAARRWALLLTIAVVLGAIVVPAQQMVTETRDPAQAQDEDFATSVKAWTTQPYFISPLVDHLPKVAGVPTPKDVLGYHIGAPAKLTYYADILKYYRALAQALPGRVRVEPIGKSDEDRELVVVWISSDDNLKNLQRNRDNLARIADPRASSRRQVRQLIATTKPQYHLMGGLHSGETGPSEMLMELAYRLATETSPLIRQIRDNVYVSITPVADPDGRDRNVDWFYRNLEHQIGQPGGGRGGAEPAATTTGAAGDGAQGPPAGGGGGGGRGGAPGVPYWGKYVFHDNNRDINLSQVSMRAIADWYFTAHPPIMHDLHESLPLLYTYSGAAPQNPNLDPILFAELPFFSNFELAQMTKWGMPGVYTHAFMDGWSPGYLGSIAYNHNGMMRMYETQAGRENAPAGRGTAAATPAATTPPAAAAATTAPAAATPATSQPSAAATAPSTAPRRRPRRTPRRQPQTRRHRPRRGGVVEDGAGAAVHPPAARRPQPRPRPRHGRRAAGRTRRRRTTDRTRRRPAARVVSRHPDPARHDRQLVAPQQHQLHADRRALGPAADVDDSRTWWSRTSTRRRGTRSSRARPTRRTASSSRSSAT